MALSGPRIDSLPSRLAFWWTRLRLPRAQRVLVRAGVWDQPLWRGEPIRTCRGCWHRYRLRLDIGDYHQRGAYFYGRMLDMHVQLCLLALLRPGDVCIDVGANIGLISMLAAHAVGPRGRVVAFEPNPDVYERLQWHVATNRLDQVSAVRCALSDREGEARLTVPPTGNTGAATLGALPARHGGRIGATYDVPMRIGDDAVGSLPAAPLLLKLDAEGHETAILRGLARTIRSRAPAVLLECNPEMLHANASGADELFDLMKDLGYEPFRLELRWGRVARRWRVCVSPEHGSWRPPRTQNVLFLRPGCVHHSRIARLLQPELRA